MNWKKQVFENFSLYAVTDITAATGINILDKIDAVCRGGADIIQLRAKGISDSVIYKMGLRVREITERYHKLYFVNDRTDLALATRADGVHLGQDDLPIVEARRLAAGTEGPFWIGQSTHNEDQAMKAILEGADYFGVGPVFQTPTKPLYEPAGLDFVRKVSRIATIPFVAIGGINASNAARVLDCGARRIAAVRALFDCDNSFESARSLHEIITDSAFRKHA